MTLSLYGYGAKSFMWLAEEKKRDGEWKRNQKMPEPGQDETDYFKIMQ